MPSSIRMQVRSSPIRIGCSRSPGTSSRMPSSSVRRAVVSGSAWSAPFTVELQTLNETGTVAAAAPLPGEGAARTRLTPLRGVKLLVVDDDADTRELLSMILQEAGAEVATAGSANDGLAAFERQRPDVLVSDIGMPDGDGYSLIRRVR